MLFVPVLSLNLLSLLRLSLARRTNTRCSAKTTNRCLPYSLPMETVMVRGDTGPCPPSSIDLTSALMLSSVVPSALCHLLSSFVFVIVVPPPIIAVDVVVIAVAGGTA